jgi:ferredoxin-NADP reductase/ferredoxin
MNEPRMAALLVAHHRPGFYFRVLEEGEVGAGDEIVKVAQGSESLRITECDALLYLPGATQKNLERALRVPALSGGWKSSFEAMLRQEMEGQSSAGNAGLTSTEQRATAVPGFRSLKVTGIERECKSVISIVLESANGIPLPVPLPGQFVVLRVRPEAGGPEVSRSYSLSGPPDAGRYRISVKEEPNGVVSTFVNTRLHVGDVVDVSAPRGAFVLEQGDRPVVLLSAGVGVTPVMAMLHSLAALASPRAVWWIQAARNGADHPFAREARELLGKLPQARSFFAFSRPDANDRQGVDFDASGRLNVDLFEKLGVPRDAEFYLCGPGPFMEEFTSGLRAWGVAADRIHTEIFGSGGSIMPGVKQAPRRAPHAPAGSPGNGPKISFARAGLSVSWDNRFQSLLELAEACDVPVRFACRSGVCHTCESGLVSGSVKYDPQPLEPPAAGNVLLCCSRPEGEVIVDI